MAVGFSGMILWWVRCLNEFEVSGNRYGTIVHFLGAFLIESSSLERIQAYINIEQEPKATKDGVPPAYWPASGDVKVENLSARYSQVSHIRAPVYRFKLTVGIGWAQRSARYIIPHQIRRTCRCWSVDFIHR